MNFLTESLNEPIDGDFLIMWSCSTKWICLFLDRNHALTWCQSCLPDCIWWRP